MALELLHHFHARAWYWHALSIAAALGLGLVRMPEEWAGPGFDLSVGSAFVFLMMWGLGAPLFRVHHHHHIEHHA